MDTFNHLLDIVVQSPHRQMALATIIDVTGSAYRKEGATMLIFEDGSKVGMLSAGCLEEDVAERAKKVIDSGEAYTIKYDTSAEDDFSWGRGAGCNGVITILIEPVKGTLLSNLIKAKKFLDRKKTVTRVIQLSRDFEILDDFFVMEDELAKGSEWNLDEPRLSNFVTGFGYHNKADAPFLATVLHPYRIIDAPILKTGLYYDNKTDTHYFIHRLSPRPRLIVFGAGEDARPVVSLAARTGFNVTVADWRPALCTEEFFPEAARLVTGSSEQIWRKISLTREDFALVMTHQFQKDQTLIEGILQNGPLTYLGVLGPADRTARLLKGARKPEWLRSPAGFSIGAQGPEEIAVSIVAEMIAMLREKETGR
ncbi:XdhC/CoxI family protein [Neobacillus notoginsengisoli]|uniref:XdhC/CoxI family protein n=2 Tax=Neobacillus notoginsengisoli TaxID=1578198 RepID=A0A417YSZ0_9BACI|nr:XdhC/CoxI family protein [Neobacillus notoginsengisoli]